MGEKSQRRKTVTALRSRARDVGTATSPAAALGVVGTQQENTAMDPILSSILFENNLRTAI